MLRLGSAPRVAITAFHAASMSISALHMLRGLASASRGHRPICSAVAPFPRLHLAPLRPRMPPFTRHSSGLPESRTLSVPPLATVSSPPVATTLRTSTEAHMGGGDRVEVGTVLSKLRSKPLEIPASISSPVASRLLSLPSTLTRLLLATPAALARGTTWTVTWIARALYTAAVDPRAARASLSSAWDSVKHEAAHYWLGSKLFAREISTSAALLRSVGRGTPLTRRERLQLKRAMGDLLRLVPFALIVIIPFAEFALPVLLRVFPRMLPSQFEKEEIRTDAFRRSLGVKLELHGILQEILADRIAAASARGGPTAEELLEQLEDVRAGKRLSSDAVVAAARMFKDEITLENMPRAQLAAVAKFLGMSPFVPEQVLRYQLRRRLQEIKADDEVLVREGGAGKLEASELRDACEERGMRAIGLSPMQLQRQLTEWVTLSVQERVPMTLLVLSRGFQIAHTPGGTAADAEAAAGKVLQETLSTLDAHIVKEVVLSQTGAGGGDSTGSKAALLAMKLDALNFQNALIEAEREAAETAAESERAQAEAERAAAVATAAQADPAQAHNVARLLADAEQAAKAVEVKQQLAKNKQAAVIRMRAADAARAAAETGSSETAAAVAQASAATDAASEAEAIRQVATGVTVAREVTLLEQMKRVQKQLAAAEMSAEGRITVGSATNAAPAAADAGTAFMRSQLERMLKDLEAELAILKTNVDLTSVLASVDANKDGAVTKEELDQALRRIVGSIHTQEAAAALIRRLDADKDGHVSVSTLSRFLDTYAARLARHEAEVARAAAGGATKTPAASGTTSDSDSDDGAPVKSGAGQR